MRWQCGPLAGAVREHAQGPRSTSQRGASRRKRSETGIRRPWKGGLVLGGQALLRQEDPDVQSGLGPRPHGILLEGPDPLPRLSAAVLLPKPFPHSPLVFAFPFMGLSQGEPPSVRILPVSPLCCFTTNPPKP